MTNEITSVKIKFGFIHCQIKIYDSRRTFSSWAGYVHPLGGGFSTWRWALCKGHNELNSSLLFFHLRLEKASVTRVVVGADEVQLECSCIWWWWWWWWWSGSLNLLEPLGPVQACTGFALPFNFTVLSHQHVSATHVAIFRIRNHHYWLRNNSEDHSSQLKGD
jgi:hypothetical protein